MFNLLKYKMATKGLNFGRLSPTKKQENIDNTDINFKEQLPSTALLNSFLINSKPKLISSIKQMGKKEQTNDSRLRRHVSNRSSLKKITDDLCEIKEQSAENHNSLRSRDARDNQDRQEKMSQCHPQKKSLIESVYITSKNFKIDASVLSPSKADSFSSSDGEDEIESIQPLRQKLKSHFQKKIGMESEEDMNSGNNLTLKSILKVSSSLHFTGKCGKSSSPGPKKSRYFHKSRSVRFGRKVLVFKYHPNSSITDKTNSTKKKEIERKKSLREIRESWFRNMKKR